MPRIVLRKYKHAFGVINFGVQEMYSVLSNQNYSEHSLLFSAAGCVPFEGKHVFYLTNE